MKERRSAKCPKCGQRVRVTIPKGGDGSVDVYMRHKINGQRCDGSRSIVTSAPASPKE